jgi:hypothetical protein
MVCFFNVFNAVSDENSYQIHGQSQVQDGGYLGIEFIEDSV